MSVHTNVLLPLWQGILTGMSVNGFSVSINERDLGGNLVEDALEALLKHAWSPTHLARQVSITFCELSSWAYCDRMDRGDNVHALFLNSPKASLPEKSS